MAPDGIEHRLVIPVHELCEILRLHRLGQGGVPFGIRGEADPVHQPIADPQPLDILRQIVHNPRGKVIGERPAEIPPLPVQLHVVPRHGTQQDHGPLYEEGEDDGVPCGLHGEPVDGCAEVQGGKGRNRREGYGGSENEGEDSRGKSPQEHAGDVNAQWKRPERHVLEQVRERRRLDLHAAQVDAVFRRVHRVEAVLLGEFAIFRGSDENGLPRDVRGGKGSLPILRRLERQVIRDGGDRPRGTVEIQDLPDAASVQADERPEDPASFRVRGDRWGTVQRGQQPSLRGRILFEDFPYLQDHSLDPPRPEEFLRGAGKPACVRGEYLLQEEAKIGVRGKRVHLECDHR